MNALSRSRLLLFSLTVLVGCRSEKVAFEFRPPAPAVAAAPPVSPPPVAAATAAAPAVAPAAPRSSGPVAGVRRAPWQRPAVSQRQEIQHVAARKPAGRKQRPADDEGDLFHVVLGSLVIVAGVLLGLLLGGWLGLGIGAAVVVLGYYFLVLGIGGKHAWLEIFQEFFNM